MAALVASGALSAETLESVASRDKRIVRQWKLDGSPRALALDADGLIYAGLAGPQAIAVIDPDTGSVLQRKVVDRAEIAATKDFVTMRTTAARDRLVIANGSDESAMILAIPELSVVREIGIEGEMVRDAVPAPDGRFVAVLGRDVHVWSRDGETLLRVIRGLSPTAIAVSPDGSVLAIASRETFGGTDVAMAVLLETTGWTEIMRRPLQTERVIRGMEFAGNGSVLLVWADDWIAEAPLKVPTGEMQVSEGRQRVSISPGELVSSETVCFPAEAAPQLVTMRGSTAILAERRCAAAASMTGGRRVTTTASLIGVEPWAILWDEKRGKIIATDPDGTLTIYQPPTPRR